MARNALTPDQLDYLGGLGLLSGFDTRGVNTSGQGTDENGNPLFTGDPAARAALLQKLQGYTWDTSPGGEVAGYNTSSLYDPSGQRVSVVNTAATPHFGSKDYATSAALIASVLGAGYGAEALAGAGGAEAGLSGMDLAADGAGGYGSLGGSAGSGGLTMQQAANSGFSMGDGLGSGLGSSGGNMSSGGTSLADFFSGNGSMSDYLRAAQTAYGLYAQNKATDAAAAGNQAQLELMARMYDQNRADNQPLVDMRNSVLPQIQNLLKNPNSITSDPGYQFQLKQGQNALNNRAAASGNYYSGAQMKAAQQYGQDYAGTKLDQSLNRLTNVAGLGQVGSNMNQQNSNNYATQGGNALAQGGNIRGSGYLGQFNTVNGAINGWQQDSIWNNLLKGKGD